MAYAMTRPNYAVNDAVYIIDTDEIGIVDEVFNIGVDVTFIAIETSDTFLIIDVMDPFIMKL